MPPLTRWFIKLGLAYLVVSLVLGVLLSGREFFGLSTSILSLIHVFLHLFMVGWVTQLIFGVGFWMFPKLSQEKPRGNQGLGWTSLVTLNVGLLMRAVAEPAHDLGIAGPFASLLLVSAFLQWLAAAVYAVSIWGRIKVK